MVNKKILITGGAGFIGSNLIRELNNCGIKNIVIVDHLNHRGKKENLSTLQYEEYFERDNFLERMNKEKLKDIKVIFHLGACTNTQEKDTRYMMKNNLEYSQRLYNFCLANGIRFVYASSAATYGDGSRGYSDTIRDLRPLNSYGLSKHLFDLWTLDHPQKLKQCVGLKFFNVYGPNESHKEEMASVVYKGYNQIKKTGVLKLFKSYNKNYKDGGQKRDFIYVKDVVKVILFFNDNPETSGMYNVGTGKARSYFELGMAIFQALNLKPKFEFIDMPRDLIAQYQNFTQADISSLRQAGYSDGFYKLEEGVGEYVKNYLSL